MDQATQISDIATSLEAIKRSLERHTASFDELKGWKTDVDARVATVDTKILEVDTKATDLNASMNDLRSKIDLIEISRQEQDPAYKVFDVEHFDLTKPGAAHLAQSSQEAASGPNGRGNVLHNRRSGCGVVTTLLPPPVTGAQFTSDHPSPTSYYAPIPASIPVPAYQLWGSVIPPMDFPQFDGQNPKMWQKKCESIFELYAIPQQNWVKIATLNFVGTADFWLQSIESIMVGIGWRELCAAVWARFEKDQHNHLLRQFFHIRQQSSVADYIKHFDELVHQLRAHDPSFSSALATSRFIDGLREDIRTVVMIQKPIDLDTASSLALLQEELTITTPRRENKRGDSYQPYKNQVKTPAGMFSAPSPTATSKQPQFSSPDEKKHVNSLKLNSTEDILNAIKAYHRAKGLCYKCGVKWGPAHKCASHVALHVVEEMWQILQDPDTLAKPSVDTDSDSGEDLMALSLYAANGTEAPKTIRVMGNLAGQTPLILLDSVSSSTFISEHMAANLSNWTPLTTPVLVKIADGATI